MRGIWGCKLWGGPCWGENEKTGTHRHLGLHPAPPATAIVTVLPAHLRSVLLSRAGTDPCWRYSKGSVPSEGHRVPWQIQAEPTSGFWTDGRRCKEIRSICRRRTQESRSQSATQALLGSTIGIANSGRRGRKESSSVSLRRRRTTAGTKGQLDQQHQSLGYGKHTTIIFRLSSEE